MIFDAFCFNEVLSVRDENVVPFCARDAWVQEFFFVFNVVRLRPVLSVSLF